MIYCGQIQPEMTGLTLILSQMLLEGCLYILERSLLTVSLKGKDSKLLSELMKHNMKGTSSINGTVLIRLHQS